MNIDNIINNIITINNNPRLTMDNDKLLNIFQDILNGLGIEDAFKDIPYDYNLNNSIYIESNYSDLSIITEEAIKPNLVSIRLERGTFNDTCLGLITIKPDGFEVNLNRWYVTYDNLENKDIEEKKLVNKFIANKELSKEILDRLNTPQITDKFIALRDEKIKYLQEKNERENLSRTNPSKALSKYIYEKVNKEPKNVKTNINHILISEFKRIIKTNMPEFNQYYSNVFNIINYIDINKKDNTISFNTKTRTFDKETLTYNNIFKEIYKIDLDKDFFKGYKDNYPNKDNILIAVEFCNEDINRYEDIRVENESLFNNTFLQSLKAYNVCEDNYYFSYKDCSNLYMDNIIELYNILGFTEDNIKDIEYVLNEVYLLTEDKDIESLVNVFVDNDTYTLYFNTEQFEEYLRVIDEKINYLKDSEKDEYYVEEASNVYDRCKDIIYNYNESKEINFNKDDIKYANLINKINELEQEYDLDR